MNLFLFIQAKPIQEIKFEHPFAKDLKRSIDDLVIFEADQFLDLTQISIGNDFIRKAKKIVLWIETKEGVDWKQLTRIFEKLRKSIQPKMTISQGEHAQLSKMLGMISGRQQKDASLDEIKSFLTSD